MNLIRKRTVLRELEQLYGMGKGLREKKPDKPAMEITLAECQSRAIELGTAVEQLAVPVEEIIRLLEQYCETLYELSLVNPTDSKFRKLCAVIQRLLVAAEEKARRILPEDKKEVVFLPYKASMWDSLESVWMAAREDQSCEAYVIPIPYYEKNNDGTFGRMHYEGDQYSSEVPITDWQEYDIARRCPEMIFIHNPYDNGNRVTSVEPMFYAKELKKHTDCLIYIPYFMGINGTVKKSLCLTAGVLHADKVIVESKEIRQIYIDTIKEWEKEYHAEGLFGTLEEKLLALGSPKTDRVHQMQKHPPAVPEEWKPVIYGSGGRKKVILYNTSLNSLLEYKEKAICKIRQVLDTFRGQCGETALLWRPHPLYENTLETMAPWLLDAYRELAAVCREADWAIYDDSPDVERAIALSDAYYGDSGSLVTLYQATGKPLMIQNYEEGIQA